MKIIHEHTEFGLDIIRGLPQAYYCTLHNIPHVCIVKQHLKELYNLVSNNVHENATLSIHNPDELYIYEGPEWSKYEWTPPPLKAMFKDYLSFDKPTVVINNKCSVEWDYSSALETANKFNLDVSLDQVIQLPNTGKASINHFSIPFLSKLIDELRDHYKILYIRPIIDKKYFIDTNILLPFNDFDFIETNYPDVYTIRQFLNNTGLTDNYTFAQFMFEATSDKHLTIAGGNAKVSAYFGGDTIIYEWEGFKLGHRKGNRDIWKSGSWLKKLSNSNIIGMSNYNEILNHVKTNWL